MLKNCIDWQKKLKIKFEDDTNECIQEKLNNAHTTYSKNKICAPEEKIKILWKLALAREIIERMKASKHIRQIVIVENQRNKLEQYQI